MKGVLAAKRWLIALSIGGVCLGSGRAEAQTWIDWTTVTAGFPAGSAVGSMSVTGGPIGVLYSGEVRGGSTSTGSSAGSYFDPVAFPGTYTSTTAPVGPTNNGWIQLIGSSQGNVLNFSSPTNRLFFAIMSLGQGGNSISYTFDRPFTILSQGPGSFGGCNTCLTQSADGLTVTGTEGDGVLMFEGPTSSLTFSIIGQESFHGFTIGADRLAAVSAIPEPGTVLLLASGLLCLVPFARRRTNA